jgi:hypothetical protein
MRGGEAGLHFRIAAWCHRTRAAVELGERVLQGAGSVAR